MSKGRPLDPKDIADIAEAALDRGLMELGQQLLDVAYDVANGFTSPQMETVLETARRHITQPSHHTH